MSQTRIASASITGVILESLSYGIFIPLLLTAGCVQWRKRAKRHSVNMVMVFTITFYGLTITSHWVVSFIHGLRGLLFLPPGEDMESFFGDSSNAFFVCKLALLEVQVLVADWVMIYRLYHIHNRNLAVCALPLVGSFAHLGLIFGTTIQAVRTHGPEVLVAWATACFSVTVFNSLCTPSLIAIRLWRTHSLLPQSNIRVSKSPVTRAMYVLIESAVLWTMFVVINFILFLTRSDARFATLDMTGPLIGISFCLVIVRLGHPERHISIRQIKTADFAVPAGTASTTSSAIHGTAREDLEQEHESTTQCSTTEERGSRMIT